MEHGEFSELCDIELRVRALESLLTEKGFVDPATLDALVQYHEEKDWPPQRGRGRGQGLDRSRVQDLVA